MRCEGNLNNRLKNIFLFCAYAYRGGTFSCFIFNCYNFKWPTVTCYIYYSLRPFSMRVIETGKEPEYWSQALGAVLARVREQRKLTFQQIADRMGSDRNYVWELEQGERKAKLPTVASLAVGLDMPLTELVGLTEKEHEEIKRRMVRAAKPPRKKKNPRP